MSTLACGCVAYSTDEPVAHVCGGYVVRDPWAAVILPPANPPTFFAYTSNGQKKEWMFDHNLGFFPNITMWAKDPAGKFTIEIAGDIQHTNANSVVIRFLTPVDGAAYCS